MKQKQKQQLPTETADRQKAAMPMRSGKRMRILSQPSSSAEVVKIRVSTQFGHGLWVPGSQPALFRRSEVSLEEMAEEMKGKFVTMEEWRKENRQVKRKLQQLQKKLERYEGRQSKKRKRCEKMEDSALRILQLQFKNQPSSRIFTNTKVEGDKSVALQLVLVDPLTEQVVSSGPESSMEVELVLVDGDFTGSESGNWTWKYLRKKIISRKRGQQPILIGEIILKLNKGIAVVRNVKIADNSSRVPSRSFRLAARVTDGYFSGMRVIEAITNPFVVIEDRLKSIQKHYPPCLEDDVWRLEGIFKNGKYHQRLKDRGIFKVQDFLESLKKNGNGLRDEILKMPLSKWEVTVKHAETCIPSGEVAPFCNQQIKPGWETSQSTEVVKQQSVQTVCEQCKVDFSSNVHIRIQNGGLLNHQQFGGSSHLQRDITSPRLAESSHMAVNGTSTSGDTLKHFGFGASTCPGEKSPAVNMSSFLNQLQENDSYGLQPEYCANPEPEFILDDILLSSPEYLASSDLHGFADAPEYLASSDLHGFADAPEYLASDLHGFADGCFNKPAESTAGKHKGNSKWSMLIMAMVFTVRIVASKGMNVENPHEA